MAQELASMETEKLAGGVQLVRLKGQRILESQTIDQIGTELTTLIDQANSSKLVVDFSNVEHLSSSVLGMLLTIDKKIQQQKGQLKLSGIRASIQEVFKITRLDQVFDIYPTLEEAIKDFVQTV